MSDLTMINPIYKPPHEGGGMFGSLMGGGLGALVGAIASVAAAYPSGGASLAALPGIVAAGASGAATGYGLGSTTGGMIGGAVDPAEAAQRSGEVPLQKSQNTSLHYMMKMPEVQLASMSNAKQLLQQSTMPGADQYISMLDQAGGVLKNRMGGSGSMGGLI
jgi:hypothetical protein